MQKNLDINGYFKKDKQNKPNKQKKQSKLKKQSKQSKPKRVTYLLPPDYIEKIKAVAFYQRKNISSLVKEIFQDFLEKNYNKKVKDVWKNKKEKSQRG